MPPESVTLDAEAGCTPPENVLQFEPDEEDEDAAFSRMQGRLSAMIAECNTALSAGPSPSETESVREEEERFARSRTSLATGDCNATHQHAPLRSTPSLYFSSRASRHSPAPSAFTGGRPPSRIPVSASPARQFHPPSSATFAFSLRPGSRARPSGPHDTFESGYGTSYDRGSFADSDGDKTPRATSARLPLASPTRFPQRRVAASPRPAWR